MYEQNSFNRFPNLDSITDRIINYLILSDSKDANRFWKLLKYNTSKALFESDVTQTERAKLINVGVGSQTNKRIFKQNFLEEGFIEECSLIKIYIDSICPTNHILANVNVSIDIMTHNKIQVVNNDSSDELEYPEYYRLIEENIMTKNRTEVLLKCLLSELNGADIAGVGVLQFNQSLSQFSQARAGLYNNKNYSGIKTILVCQQSGV